MDYIKTLSILTVVALGGCNDSERYTDEQISSAIYCSNTNEDSSGSQCSTPNSLGTWGVADNTWGPNQCDYHVYCLPEGSAHPEPENQGLTVWAEPIPIYFYDKEDPRFTFALAKLEEMVGKQLFDIKGTVALDISDPSNIDYSHLDTDYGLILGRGTTICGTHCGGTFHEHPFNWNVVRFIMSEDNEILRPSGNGFGWVSIDGRTSADSPLIIGNAGKDVAVHELMHALGAANHFNGFGDKAGAFSANADLVIRTMYHENNPPGQPYNALYIPR
ncbi:hypothetical protein [Vibrio sp. WXL103]|uniref:hypothetical protein n=1 Tax=unclassified Vibrio TaxID=2614977 RepID=UPI003EC8E23B